MITNRHWTCLRQIYTTQMSVIRKIGRRTPSASFGGSTNSMIGMLSDPNAPPKPDLEIATAVTDTIQIAQKNTGEAFITSICGIGPHLVSCPRPKAPLRIIGAADTGAFISRKAGLPRSPAPRCRERCCRQA